LRRRALQDIGGFATGSVTEDLHTSLRLHEKGYQSVYLPHVLAYGIAVLDAGEYMQQRLRWGQGAMQVWRRERVLTNRKLTLPQRLNYFSSIITYFEGWQRAIFYTVPAYALLSGKLPIHITVPEFLAIFLPYLAITFWTFGILTRGHSHLVLSEEYNFARFALFCQSTLGFFRRRLPFVVSGKKRNPHPPVLAPLYPQLLVLGFNAVAIPVGVLHYSHGNLALAALIVNVFWAGFVMSIAIGLLRFTRTKARDRRQEYRFTIPICARIQLEGQPERLVTVDNLSPQGFGFRGGLSGPIEVGKEVAGYLHLASGPMPFFGWIRSVRRAAADSGPPRPVYGCQFEAIPEGVLKQLEAFLHGNDLQWHFLGISDHTRQLLGAHGSESQHQHGDLRSARVGHWQCCTYSDPLEPALRGIISAPGFGPDGDRRMVVMQKIPKRRVVVRVEGPNEEPEFVGEVREDASVRTADGPVYFYTLQNIRSTTPWTYSSAYA
jgi:cellulose synthase (UDP-forming)